MSWNSADGDQVPGRASGVTVLSGRAALVGGAVMVLCVGGVLVAAAVGASPAPTPQLGGPVVVVSTGTPTGGPTTSPSSSRPGTGEHSGGAGTTDHDEDHSKSHDAQVVQPAPVHEVDDEDHDSEKSSGG